MAFSDLTRVFGAFQSGREKRFQVLAERALLIAPFLSGQRKRVLKFRFLFPIKPTFSCSRFGHVITTLQGPRPYATSTFVFHLAWVLQSPQEKKKIMLMQNFGGQIRWIMGNVEMVTYEQQTYFRSSLLFLLRRVKLEPKIPDALAGYGNVEYRPP